MFASCVPCNNAIVQTDKNAAFPAVLSFLIAETKN